MRGTNSLQVNANTRNSTYIWQESLKDIEEKVQKEAPRIKSQGNWPSFIDENSLTERIPSSTKKKEDTSGFDAGVACALDLIPKDKQELASVLHAAYTKEAVQKVQEEARLMDPDSETTWWLAACSLCQEGGVTEKEFRMQLQKFEILRRDKNARQNAALNELSKMKQSYQVKDNVAWGERDGSMQGAYLGAHKLAVLEDKERNLFFLGTYEESLGLENFPYDNNNHPVHGSRQFVVFSDKPLLEKAISKAKNTLHLS